MIDIKGDSSNPAAARLSNFHFRYFTFRDVYCASIESILQSLKCRDVPTQIAMCRLNPRHAKKYGVEWFSNWKETQTLWWNKQPFGRSTKEYLSLVTDIYDSVFKQDSRFENDLVEIGYEEISHSIGNPNMSDTVLTEVEMLYQLNRLRLKSLANHRLVR